MDNIKKMVSPQSHDLTGANGSPRLVRKNLLNGSTLFYEGNELNFVLFKSSYFGQTGFWHECC